MAHTTESLLRVVHDDPERLSAAMGTIGTAAATDLEMIALEITSMSDDQRAEALFAASLALAAASATFRALGIHPGGHR